MSHLDPSLQQLVGALVILLGTINVYYLKKIRQDAKEIKNDTTQVNNAVNHVGPDGKTLTVRVDRIEETLHTIQYEQDIAKKAAISAKDEIVETKGMVEGLMASHVDLKKKLDNMLDVMPKRKTD